MLAMLMKVTHDYTEDDGSPGRELTSAYIADTMTTQMEKQVGCMDAAGGRHARPRDRHVLKGPRPRKTRRPVAKDETMETMFFYEVYSCPRSAPWNQILQPAMEVALQEMELYVSRDVINARRLTPGHKTSNKSDPDKYRTFMPASAEKKMEKSCEKHKWRGGLNPLPQDSKYLGDRLVRSGPISKRGYTLRYHRQPAPYGL
ncbi:unnamed protein product [Ectocarpus sp. CCAP 1310/34]|nr:unnamed protein product [Ectocarpus sp. CCAP 1310/34]